MSTLSAVVSSPDSDRPDREPAPRWAWVAVFVLVLGSFLSFALTLDRYVPWFEDEPFFNASAVRIHEGRSFHYPLHSEAPHGGDLWAYHGPFYFRLQVATFGLLGPSHFAARIPGYLAGHLALLLLCIQLLRMGLGRSAVALALFWIGDRASREVALGRPEGLCLLFATLGALFLFRALRGRSSRPWIGVSLCIGLAGGFNPAAVWYALAVAAMTVLALPPPALLRALRGLALGAVVPVTLFVACWLPDLGRSLEQFLWYVGLSTGSESAPGLFFVRMLGSGDWTYPLILALLLTGLVVLLPNTLSLAVAHRRALPVDARATLAMVLGTFGLSGTGLFATSSTYPYYEVLLSVWVVAAVAVLAARRRELPRWSQRTLMVQAAMLAVLWVPSLGWKLLRMREAVLLYEHLDKAPLAAEIAARIPADVAVAGDPVYFLLAHEAGLRFTPLNFFASDLQDPQLLDQWLLLSPRYETWLREQHPDFERRVQRVHEGIAFGSSEHTRQRYAIYAPQPR